MKLLSGTKSRRQKSALQRLEEQLVRGTKNVAEYDGSNPIPVQRPYPLTDKDVKRIKAEIAILKAALGK